MTRVSIHFPRSAWSPERYAEWLKGAPPGTRSVGGSDTDDGRITEFETDAPGHLRAWAEFWHARPLMTASD